uniref:Uncharacterized protein n=1 Tax=Arundo donax TaxID=35708 RepID=A0A0A9HI66_ARUDO
MSIRGSPPTAAWRRPRRWR